MGDATTGGLAGFVWNKLSASDLTYAEYRIGGVSQLTWDKRFTSAEDLEWRHYDSSGVLTGVAMALAYDATDFSNTELQVQNLNVAGNHTVNGTLFVADAADLAPQVVITKDATGTSQLKFRSEASDSWRLTHTSGDDFQINKLAGANVMALSQSTSLARFYAGVQVDGDVTRANGMTTTWGDGTETGTGAQTGSIYTKADAGGITTSSWQVGSAGSGLKWGFKFDTNEALKWQVYNDSGVLQGSAMELTRNANHEQVENRRTRDALDLGTGLVTGDFSLSAGWGTTASVDVAVGTDSWGAVEVTANGTGIAADPTITLTFTDGAWSEAPIAMLQRNDNQTPNPNNSFLTYTTTTTTLVITFRGTPSAGQTYRIEFRCAVS